jgi:alpha-tubulin suppressor-like RCC1 family protein
VACGWNNTFILSHQGEVYSTGYGRFGQLGFLNENKSIPDSVDKFNKIQFEEDVFINKIYSGSDFAVVIDSGN